MGIDQDENGLVLRHQEYILATSDYFIPTSMPKLSIFSKKRYQFLSKNGQNQGLIFVQFCWKIPELSWHQKSWSLQFLRVFVVVSYQKNFESTHFSLNVEMCRFLNLIRNFCDRILYHLYSIGNCKAILEESSKSCITNFQKWLFSYP